jgi:hypothetical protein
MRYFRSSNLAHPASRTPESLSWVYAPFEYLSQRELWQVSNRYLVSGVGQTSAFPYSLT